MPKLEFQPEERRVLRLALDEYIDLTEMVASGHSVDAKCVLSPTKAVELKRLADRSFADAAIARKIVIDFESEGLLDKRT